ERQQKMQSVCRCGTENTQVMPGPQVKLPGAGLDPGIRRGTVLEGMPGLIPGSSAETGMTGCGTGAATHAPRPPLCWAACRMPEQADADQCISAIAGMLSEACQKRVTESAWARNAASSSSAIGVG